MKAVVLLPALFDYQDEQKGQKKKKKFETDKIDL